VQTARRDNANGMPHALRTNLESLSGFDLSSVRVHRNSTKPDRLNALAYTQGSDIYLAPGEERHLPHEGWHVVQQMQGRVAAAGLRIGGDVVNHDPTLESEADRMGARASAGMSRGGQHLQSKNLIGGFSSYPVQRAVRIGGGATRVNEAEYLPGGPKSAIGTRYSVASLIGDRLRRVFTGVTELESYANGGVDYIGDVVPTNGAIAGPAGRFWYRLPGAQVTVLGEEHRNPDGNVEDVITGFRTARFMYEPFNAMTNVAGQSLPFTGTQARLTTLNSSIAVAPQANRATFNPDLENIVIKAMTGSVMARNMYIAGNPRTMSAADRARWGSRSSASGYSEGERVALYVAMGIHLAADLAAQPLPQPGSVPQGQRPLIRSERNLAAFYRSHQAVLDAFMNTKDNDNLIGIYELTSPNNFRNLEVIRLFTLAMHEYGARYLEQLGVDTGNATLQSEGRRLATHRGGDIDDLGVARAEIMWGRLQQAIAGGYLIVGMGDQHRQDLLPRLTAAGIPNAKVDQDLIRQRDAVNAAWVP
jgi:Domain of unknown function (DUF4157)